MRCVAALLALPLLGAAQASDEPVKIGTGCFLDLTQTIDLYGQICHAGQNPEFAAALTQSVFRIEKMYVERGVSATDIAAIRARNAAETAGDSACKGDAEEFYQAMLKQGPAALRKTTDVIVARPGKPTYGDCF